MSQPPALAFASTTAATDPPPRIFVAGPCARCGTLFVAAWRMDRRGDPDRYCRTQCAKRAHRRRAELRADPWGPLWDGLQRYRPRVEEMCRGKKRHASAGAGRCVARHMIAAGKASGLLHTYACPVCLWWHTGSGPRRPAQMAQVVKAAQVFRERLIAAGRLDELLAEWAVSS